MARTPTPLSAIRHAIADYMWAEGCSCCRDYDAHKDAAERIGKLLRFPKYPDGSAYDFYSKRSATLRRRGPKA